LNINLNLSVEDKIFSRGLYLSIESLHIQLLVIILAQQNGYLHLGVKKRNVLSFASHIFETVGIGVDSELQEDIDLKMLQPFGDHT